MGLCSLNPCWRVNCTSTARGLPSVPLKSEFQSTVGHWVRTRASVSRALRCQDCYCALLAPSCPILLQHLFPTSLFIIAMLSTLQKKGKSLTSSVFCCNDFHLMTSTWSELNSSQITHHLWRRKQQSVIPLASPSQLGPCFSYLCILGFYLNMYRTLLFPAR